MHVGAFHQFLALSSHLLQIQLLGACRQVKRVSQTYSHTQSITFLFSKNCDKKFDSKDTPQSCEMFSKKLEFNCSCKMILTTYCKFYSISDTKFQLINIGGEQTVMMSNELVGLLVTSYVFCGVVSRSSAGIPWH